jgi:TolB-like protein/Tfp pilus assembly protein PilF
VVTLVIVVITGLLIYHKSTSSKLTKLEKSIAVLPFKNDSDDSTNVYLINGLMESTLNNLQKIQDLKVISRTSSEKYRSTSKTIPEMARELSVNYFIEGSGQKIGDKILLNIQLIEGPTDKHLWAKQYRREAKDIFALQREVAQDIVEEIQIVITPEEEKRIEKSPTDDPVAYDLYLKGANLWDDKSGDTENAQKAVSYFKQAIARDPEFALAHAAIAITYYYQDYFKKEQKFTDEITQYSDKALLLDPKLAESLIAKAFYYMHIKEFKEAGPYFEKALEYNPNSMLAINSLADYYATYVPNTKKYLEYALKGVRLEKASNDSMATSWSYLRLGNALVQNGFADEADKCMDKVLEYNTKNPFARYIKTFIHYAKGGKLEETRALLLREFNKDTMRIDMLNDLGKISYYMEDYKAAYEYDRRLFVLKEALQVDVYKHENLRIGVALAKMGFRKESQEVIESFRIYMDRENSVYRDLGMAMYYCYRGDYKKTLELLDLFAKKDDHHQYWLILFLDKDPIIVPLRNNPEYKRIISDIQAKFWKNHEEIKADLKEKGLL